jgi:hypothetical protein
LKHLVKFIRKFHCEKLCIIPETEIEEKFFIWFSFQYGVPLERLNNRDSLAFDLNNDPEVTMQNLANALKNYCIRFRYVYVPDVRGIHLEKASKILNEAKVTWAVEKETFSDQFNEGHVIYQNPRHGTVSKPKSVVYLTVSLGPEF